MIVVKVYLWPGGKESEESRLGTAYITKEGGSSTTTYANYDFRIEGKVAGGTVGHGKGRIENWPRKRYHVWRLVREVLNDNFLSGKRYQDE